MTTELRQYLESARNIVNPEERIRSLAGCIRVIREMGDNEAEELVNSLIREAINEHNANLVKDAVFDEVEISKV
jgi:hypothetical protein